MTRRPPRRFANGSRLALSFLLGTTPLLGGCGSSSSHRSASTALRSISGSRLAASQGQRVAVVCRDAETSEDQNVVTQFAAEGARILSPAIPRSLRIASAHIAREGVRLRSMVAGSTSGSALAEDITAESQILRRSAGLDQIRTDQAALLTALHHRVAAAQTAGVPGCDGVTPGALPNISG
jgi:hypothetical protein